MRQNISQWMTPSEKTGNVLEKVCEESKVAKNLEIFHMMSKNVADLRYVPFKPCSHLHLILKCRVIRSNFIPVYQVLEPFLLIWLLPYKT